MISISTDDGETFDLTVGEATFEIHRNDLVPFLDHAKVLLEVTRELIVDTDEP